MIRTTSKFVLAAMLSLAVSAWAATPASVSGVVQDGDHAPLMGAVVQLFGAEPFPLLTAFTDIHGHYEFLNLAPGRYSVRVVQVASVPARRKNIWMDGNTHAVVNLTLLSLFNASQWFPAVARSEEEPADEWTWTLRSGMDRPILRWMEDADGAQGDGNSDPGAAGNDLSLDEEGDEEYAGSARRVRGHVLLSGGSSQFGESGFRQEAFVLVPTDGLGESVVHLQTSTTGAVYAAAGIESDPGGGDRMRAAVSYRTLPVRDGAGNDRLQIFEIRGGEHLALSDALLAEFGAEIESAQAGQNDTAAFPFINAHFHAAGDEISYRLATSSEMQGLTNLASPGDVPAISMRNGDLRLTRAVHQEVSVERTMAKIQIAAAYFYDFVNAPALNGYGDGRDANFGAGDILLDPKTGAFRATGPDESGGGFRMVAARPVNKNVWAAVEYAQGQTIALPRENAAGQSSFTAAAQNLTRQRAQTVLFCMRGTVPRIRTRWDAGYRWQREATITPVDSFNTAANAPFFSLTLHQPLLPGSSSQAKLELEVMMQNLLAQGYRPVYVVDGQTLYFAQSQRLVAGGLAFSF